MDQNEEERSRGLTIHCAKSQFETKSKKFTILDAPGHMDFIPNMISGAAQADCGILVIDSYTQAFETGFETGTTKEHAILARSLGVT
jgi:translation elongation factor EF-1alpha